MLEEKVEIETRLLDLNSLLSVQSGAKELNSRLRERGLGLDVLVCNAGIGGWDGLDWGVLIKQFVTQGLYNIVARPEYKRARIGKVAQRQLPLSSSGTKGDGPNGCISKAEEEEPPLGELFCANIFGHYMFGHWLAPSLLRAGADDGKRGRMIWVSSLEAYARVFDINDVQGLTTPLPYESSKRLTDILVLTSELPSTQPYVSSYFSTGTSAAAKGKAAIANGTAEIGVEADLKPRTYVSHPGICATGIMPIHSALFFLEVLLFELMRICGSYWHTVSPWPAAVAPAWLALAPQKLLDTIEGDEGKGKWGSSRDVWGRERVTRTEIQGWGWGGRVGEKRLKTGRWDEWVNSEESLEEFEELGARAWGKMEELRKEWEELLSKAEE